METYNYKDDRFSIRPQAPPGGETHFNISDSGYGDKNIYHPHKRNNHPSNDINPPPNFVKKEQVVESTPNGAPPVTGNRPSIKLRAPPGGYSSLDYYSEETSKPVNSVNSENPITQNAVVCDEPQTETKLINESDKTVSKPTKSGNNSKNSSTSSLFSNDPAPVYKPYYAPQAPPGGKSSISFGNYDTEAAPAPKPKPRPNPEFQESMFSTSNTTTSPSTGRRMSNQNKQNNQTTFNSSFFGSSEDNKPYKPYYAPQAPPGGKDSISLGSSEPDNTTQTSFSGRRRNYNRDHFKSSINFNY